MNAVFHLTNFTILKSIPQNSSVTT